MLNSTAMPRNKKELLSVFGLHSNFDYEQLKAAYKKLVIKHHPDKVGVRDSPAFKYITACYKLLYDDLRLRAEEKPHNELQMGFQEDVRKFNHVPIQSDNITGPNFNVNKFNELYEHTRIADPNDAGYAKWKQQAYNKVENDARNTVVLWKEPQPLVSSIGNAQYYELGVDKVRDFSAPMTAAKTLPYMDLKMAHTTSKLVREDMVEKRREYRTLQELEADRASIQHKMSARDLMKHMKQQKLNEEKEMRRIKSQMERDRLLHDHFIRNNNVITAQLTKS